MGMLARSSIEQMGFASLGQNVLLSDKASFYNCAGIHLGSNVRIDDFCVVSAGAGGIHIGDHVHIAAFCALMGAGRITLSDFAGLSSRVSIYSSSDDYSGAAMTNPTVPRKYTNVVDGPVFLGRHVIIGAGSVVLPNVRLEDGVAVGALALVTRDCAAFGIYAGNPAKRIAARKPDLLQLEQQLLRDRGE